MLPFADIVPGLTNTQLLQNLVSLGGLMLGALVLAIGVPLCLFVILVGFFGVLQLLFI